MRASTGQVLACPLRAWPTTSFSVPFFCFVKVRATKVASWIRAGSPVAAGIELAPMRKITSQSRNGCESAVGALEVCSPGRSRKKKPTTARSAAAMSVGVIANVTAWLTTANGSGWTRVTDGSDRVNPFNICWITKWTFPCRSYRGSSAPTLASVCPTARRAASTVRDLTGF